MHTEAAITAARPATIRSRVSNRSKVLAGVDGRSAAARRYRDLVADYARDLGGADQLSTAELNLVRQAAALVLRAEQLQAQVVRGEAISGDELIRLSGEARRILVSVQKRMKPRAHVPLRERLAAEAAGGLGEAAR